MQDEVNEKTIALCVQCGKMTADVLKAAMRKYLNEMEQHRQGKKQTRQAEKNGRAQERGRLKEQKHQQKKEPHGKQSLRKLKEGGAKLANIAITDQNIKSFEKIARRRNIDYSLKRDNSVSPPKYLVFFRTKDIDDITDAFKEYAGVTLKKTRKPSVRKKLQNAIERLAKHRERVKTRQKDRGQER